MGYKDAKRKRKYDRLRKAGFTSYEANKYKDYPENVVDKLISIQNLRHLDIAYFLKHRDDPKPAQFINVVVDEIIDGLEHWGEDDK